MSRKRNHRSASPTAGRRAIRIETLERRELLAADLGFHHNLAEPMDVNNDTAVSPIDALMLINRLNADDPSGVPSNADAANQFMDVSNDGALSPVDVLMVVNRLNRRDGPDHSPRDGQNRPSRPQNHPTEPEETAPLDGSGNNQENPDLGSVGEEFERWVDSDYSDGTTSPAAEGNPSAREISNIVNAQADVDASALGLSDLTWVFGQFIDHDITLTASGDGEDLSIEVPDGDAWFDPFGTGEAAISLERSGYSLDENGVRQQLNIISAFIDGSAIYGSDTQRADALRTFESGLLATSDGDLLPFNTAGLDNAGGTSETLFLAGDVRANENAALTAMHTVWVREHNRIAQRIASEDPTLSDEEIYQSARRIVIGQLQAITYYEFLPALLGEDAIAEYSGYDSTVNPNISNVFATAAYRFGHTMLPEELLRIDSAGETSIDGNLPLQEAFFNVDALSGDGVSELLRGASVQTAEEVDPYLVDAVRNFLFGPPGSGGFDLAALNIQRGRDHGLPGYNQVRHDMGLQSVTSFAEITGDIEVQQRLEEAYGNVDSIDAWVGMLAEQHAAGSALGITASTIIAEQFTALRDGDRFYYENIFGGRELERIDSTTLADVIARNTDIDFAPGQNVFFASDGLAADDADRPDRRRDRPRNTRPGGGQSTPPIQIAASDLAIMQLEEERRQLLF